jgi:hypothetical protein
MAEKRKSAAAPILAGVAIVLVLLGAYVGGYFWANTQTLILQETQLQTTKSVRMYRWNWQCRVFMPMAWLETKVSGREVLLGSLQDAKNLPALAHYRLSMAFATRRTNLPRLQSLHKTNEAWVRAVRNA